MADDYHAASVPFEQAPGDRVGPMELRDGAGPFVRPDRGQQSAGGGHAALGADRAPTVARMVLRHPAQTRPPAPSAARGDVFCPLVGLGGELVAEPATGTGP